MYVVLWKYLEYEYGKCGEWKLQNIFSMLFVHTPHFPSTVVKVLPLFQTYPLIENNAAMQVCSTHVDLYM